jgi:ribosomal protein S18 acetylase RimI-like enzyme
VKIGPLDLHRHAGAAIALAREAFVESFGSSERFEREQGAEGERLVPFLQERQRTEPRWVVGAEEDGRLVGLLVLGAMPGPPPRGHLVLLAVEPAARGGGLAQQLLALAVETLCSGGWDRARLHVTERNARAMRFYLREGWTDQGEHPDVGGVRILERPLGSLH